jgi:hypothetical protein
MKKIIEQHVKEKCEYYDDFTGESLAPYCPTTVKIDFGYLSNHDMESYEFHLNGQNGERLLKIIELMLNDGNLESRKL